MSFQKDISTAHVQYARFYIHAIQTSSMGEIYYFTRYTLYGMKPLRLKLWIPIHTKINSYTVQSLLYVSIR